MNEIMEKTYELIDVLEESEMIKNLFFYKDKIMNNEELQKLIHEGNSNNDSYKMLDIKRKLYKDLDYCGYIDSYNELMYLVMDINSRFKKIIGEGSCHR